MASASMAVRTSDVVVVGSGISGLVTALSLAPLPVTLITKTPQLPGGSSLWAQGGIAAAVGPGDSAAAHAADTLSAGAGLSNPERAMRLTEEGADSLAWLIEEGIVFDRDDSGSLALAKEAAHRFPRVVHARGDMTGDVLVQGLVDRVRMTPSVTVREGAFAFDLVVRRGKVSGLLTFEHDNGWTFHRTDNVVLCTGGIGMAWWHTTNPLEATGDGLAMAARAGARLANLEFVQFHPTALATAGGASMPLLTEALRGAGATLCDASGQRFMPSEHALAELAPRDIVARATQKRIGKGDSVYLDLRHISTDTLQSSFPKAIETATQAGFDPRRDLLPVAPAAHYHMGGVDVDDNGRSSIQGLWACGEVANTGVHGANRLASNSLLEAVVYAKRVASRISAELGRSCAAGVVPAIPVVPVRSAAVELDRLLRRSRQTMSRQVGVLRDGEELTAAYFDLCQMERRLRDMESHRTPMPTSTWVRRWGEARNLNLIARLVTRAALRRKESRGAHYRDDFPRPRPEWRRAQSLTMQAQHPS